MTRSNVQTRTAKGFTLIELLVVIGIIAILAAGVGVALRGNNPDASLRAAQGLASSAMSAARGQAALSQSNARLLVQADASRDDFLRSICVVIPDPDPTKSGQWKQVGTEIVLPEGVYVVPPSNPQTGVTFDSTGGSWNVGRNSTLLRTAAGSDVAGLTGFAASTTLVSKDITSLGTVDGGGRIVVTSGRRSGAATITLNNASAVRGLSLSRYGVPTLIDDPASFDLITN